MTKIETPSAQEREAAQGTTAPPDQPVSLELRSHSGTETTRRAATTGQTLLDIVQEAGWALPAICGGKGACGTCRVHIAPQWHTHLPEPHKRELRLLAHLGAGPADRLACRIALTAEMEGIEIENCMKPKTS